MLILTIYSSIRKEKIILKIKSISDIPNAVFYPLKNWATSSTNNWNILIGAGIFLLVLGGVLIWSYSKKIGREDEYSQKIYYRACISMLLTIVFCDIVFPKTYMWNQFFLFKYALAFTISGISMAINYRKDFI